MHVANGLMNTYEVEIRDLQSRKVGVSMHAIVHVSGFSGTFFGTYSLDFSLCILNQKAELGTDIYFIKISPDICPP